MIKKEQHLLYMRTYLMQRMHLITYQDLMLKEGFYSSYLKIFNCFVLLTYKNVRENGYGILKKANRKIKRIDEVKMILYMDNNILLA